MLVARMEQTPSGLQEILKRVITNGGFRNSDDRDF
jgi:hypothetical protein